MATDKKVIEFSNRIKSIKSSDDPAVNHIVAGADDIYDDEKGKKQSEVNAETDATLAEHTSTINGLNSQNYVTVTATDQTTAVTDVLPATGEVATVYRVGNWDGSQYDETCYSEYSWNGSAYVHLSTKTQIGEVFDISAYHATGGTLATYADLAAALGTNGANIPESLRKGGMSVKYVLTDDNKYVQYRLMSDTFNTTVANWQGVDTKITSGSKNLAESGAAFAALFHDNDWNNAPEFKACITRDGFIYNNADGNCKILTIKPNDVISITGGSNGGYAAILSDLPIYGVATAPYATYHTNRVIIQANTVVDITVNANSNAKYLIVEASRTIDNAAVDETPAAFTINGITMLVDRKTLIDKCIGNLKQGIFVPRWNDKFVLITDSTIVIPASSRIAYKNTYYQNNDDVTLNRTDGWQYDICVFNISTRTYQLLNPNYDFLNSDYLFCFYVRHNGECSLSTSLYKYNGKFAFTTESVVDDKINDAVEKNNTAIISSGRVEGLPGATATTTTAIENVTLIKGAKYKIRIKSDSPFTYTGKNLALKIYSSTSTDTVLLVAALQTVPIDYNYFEFVWPYDTVYDYRIGFYNRGSDINIGIDVEFSVFSEGLYVISEDAYVESRKIANCPVFVPRFNDFVTITETTITIPLGTRIFYDGTTYYQNASAITLERTVGAQAEMVVFDVENQEYLIKSAGAFDVSDKNLLLCFYIRYDGTCSLSPCLYKYLGNYAFVKEYGVESIFAYNNKKDIENKLLQLRSIQDGSHDVTNNSQSLANTSSMLVLLHFSDLHADVNNLSRIVEFWNEYKNTNISDIIHTGDSAYSRIDDNKSVPMVFEKVSGAERILNVVGNHDAWLTGTSWYEATSKQSYDYLFKGTGTTPIVNNWGVTQPTNAESLGLCYYHKDYTTKKIRLIVLDCMHNDTAQETWFEGLLNDTLTEGNDAYGYHVIIAVHYQSQYGLTAKNTTFNCLNGDVAAVTKSNYPSPNTDVTDIPDITGTYHVERLPNRMYQKVNTFITNGGKFICWLCGHTHNDYFGTVPGYDSQLQITINTANRTKGDNYNWETRTNHTQSCDCFNVVGFDTLHKVIKVVRVGVNRDSRMRYINTMCYDYQDGIVISNN